MKIVVAGASGLVGSALVPALRAQGHDVRRLVRRAPKVEDEIAWDPARGELERERFAGTQVVINLAGENLASGRWTAARRERIRRSRIEATRTLVAAMAAADPRPAVLINASAVGFYGDRGDAVQTETSGKGEGFLADVCEAWEAEAARATESGARVAYLRFGVILAAQGGALAKMLPVFRLGLGGRLGSGRQWMSWITLTDVVAAIGHVVHDTRAAGAINAVAPGAVTNRDFTQALGTVLHRPVVFPIPAWALRAAVGQGMADEALLGSTRATPQRLNELGFTFQHPTIDEALAAVLKRPTAR
jgi:uncharacterized protein (TIGR01777 family)